MKRFAIIGLTAFSRELALNLCKLGNEVTVIDRDKEKILAVAKQVTSAISADANNKEFLEKLSIDQMDGVVVSAFSHASVRFIITMYLKELGAKNIMAEAVDRDDAHLLTRVGAGTVINPELDMAQHLAVRLNAHNFLEYVQLSKDYKVVEIAPPFEFLNKSIIALDLRRRYNVHIIGIRDVITEKFTIVPAPDHIIKDSEILIVIGSEADLKRLRQE